MKFTVVFAILLVVGVTTSVNALTQQQTQKLWHICRQDKECSSAFHFGSEYSVGNIPLEDGSESTDQIIENAIRMTGDPTDFMFLSQFKAFSLVANRQCAIRSAEGEVCSSLNLETIDASPQIWSYRMQIWALTGAIHCHANQILMFNNESGSLECRCRMDKICLSTEGSGNADIDDLTSTVDGVTIQFLIVALVVMGAVNLGMTVVKFMKKRFWWGPALKLNPTKGTFSRLLQQPPSPIYAGDEIKRREDAYEVGETVRGSLSKRNGNVGKHESIAIGSGSGGGGGGGGSSSSSSSSSSSAFFPSPGFGGSKSHRRL